MTPAAARQRRLAYAAWLAICVIWGTTYFGIRVSLESMPPALMGGFRWTIAGVLLAVYVVARGGTLPPRARNVAMVFQDGKPDWVRVALGAVAPTVIRAPETEKALMSGGYEGLKRAKDAVRQEVQPIDDIRSTQAYRREMAAVLLERAVRALAEA